MKLYYATGTCSLAPHIVAEEAEISVELERVDIKRTPHRTQSGADFSIINANGYVPALVLDDGEVLTEGVAIMQYIADLRPETGLAPPCGTIERTRLQSWLNFIATELHKMFSPWLFHPEYGAQAQDVAREKIAGRLAHIDGHLGAGAPFLMGKTFSAADAYLFTVLGWSDFGKVDLSLFPHIADFMETVATRPAVKTAMRGQGMAVED